MKKRGILNAQLMCELTKLRHQDQFVICDIGFPIPKNANVVDVSLVEGIPSFQQTVKAVLNELVVESYIIFDFMQEVNPEYYKFITDHLKEQTSKQVSMDDFVELAKNAKLFIRTGDSKPASNILLTSATGVWSMCSKLDISFEEIT